MLSHVCACLIQYECVRIGNKWVPYSSTTRLINFFVNAVFVKYVKYFEICGQTHSSRRTCKAKFVTSHENCNVPLVSFMENITVTLGLDTSLLTLKS